MEESTEPTASTDQLVYDKVEVHACRSPSRYLKRRNGGRLASSS